jgi:hypothetical protein
LCGKSSSGRPVAEKKPKQATAPCVDAASSMVVALKLLYGLDGVERWGSQWSLVYDRSPT